MKTANQLKDKVQTISSSIIENAMQWRREKGLMFTVLTLALLMSLTQTSWAKKYIPYGYKFEPYDKYEELRKPGPNRGTYLKDPNVWVYTSEFADRFGMPEKWVDNSLKGAEAIAYRIEQSNTQTCGFFGEIDNCSPNLFCVMDIYLTDQDGAKLPWESHKLSAWSDWDRSEMFLSVQRENDDRYWYDETQDHRYLRKWPMGVRSIAYVGGLKMRRKDGTYKVFSSHGNLRMRSYRRDFFQGLDLLQIKGCGIATIPSRPVSIYFLDPQPSMNDPQYRLANGKINRAKLDAAKERRFARFNAGTPPHRIDLPDTYMDSVNTHDEAVRQQRSLAAEALQRYQQGNKNMEPPTTAPSFWQRLFQ